VFTGQQLMDNVHRYKPGSIVALRFRRRSTICDTFVVMGSEGEMTGTAVGSTIRLEPDLDVANVRANLRKCNLRLKPVIKRSCSNCYLPGSPS
jgi:hypothetical protein